MCAYNLTTQETDAEGSLSQKLNFSLAALHCHVCSDATAAEGPEWLYPVAGSIYAQDDSKMLLEQLGRGLISCFLCCLLPRG